VRDIASTRPISWNGELRLLAACRKQAVDCTPIWFLRQTSRVLHGYRRIRQDYSLLEVVQVPELIAEITLMPVHEFGVDAAVMFSDLLLPLQDMGVFFEIEDGRRPIVLNPIRCIGDINQLRVPPRAELTPNVMKAIKLVRQQLNGSAALIGFCAGPYTLAGYIVTGKPSLSFDNQSLVKKMMLSEPIAWAMLMEKITSTLENYIAAQIHAGVQVMQIFDSWVGALAPADYDVYVLPYTRRLFELLSFVEVPSIHFATGSGGLLERIAIAGGDVVSLDWRIAIDEAWTRLGIERAVQGNLDPVVLLSGRTATERAVWDVLQRAQGRVGHVFNVGHGLIEGTDPGLLRYVVDLVHEKGSVGALAEASR
jgi:uroporphyrinogen decarboxylase